MPLTRYCLTALLIASTLSALVWSQVPSQQNQVSAPPTGASVIQHFVFIIKENHSFDNYFGQFPGALGATKGKLADGRLVKLQPMPDVSSHGLGHTTRNALTAMNNGKMDGFDLIDQGNTNGDLLSYRQFDSTGIPNYWYYAQHFTLADQMFTSYHGPSVPNHLYSVAATSNGVLDLPIDLLAPEENSPSTGCDATPTTAVRTLDAQGNLDADFPCFDFQTLVDELQSAGVSWKYYAPSMGEPGYAFSTLDTINHIRNSDLWTEDVVPDTQFVQDALAGNLPSVSWLVTGAGSEHPPNSTCVGENWSVQQINAVMQGADWNSTAIILVWDDFGGLYDHYPPPQVDGFGFGPRVPMIIISPYSLANTVIHTQYEFSSVLKTIESRFNLAPLTERDTAAKPLWNTFDFNQSPIPPQILTARSCPFATTSYALFGSQGIGTPSPVQEIPLVNPGNAPITISSIVAAGDYSQTNNCPKSLNPGYKCSVSAVFKPSVLGPDSGSITITDSDVGSPQVIDLNGTGSQVNFNHPYPGIQFETVTFGSKRTLTAVLTNVSTTPVTISSVSLAGLAAQDFSQTSTCSGTIAPGGNCQWNVSFTPSPQSFDFYGYEFVNFVVTDSAPGSPHTMRLSGIGTALALSPSGELSFGNQAVGTTSTPQTITVKNTWSNPITVGGVATVGDYAIASDTCGSSIAPGATCTLSVTFTPQVSGPDDGILNLNDNDTASPQQFKLTGAGTGTSTSARVLTSEESLDNSEPSMRGSSKKKSCSEIYPFPQAASKWTNCKSGEFSQCGGPAECSCAEADDTLVWYHCKEGDYARCQDDTLCKESDSD